MYCTDVRTTARLLDLSIAAIYARIRRQQMSYMVIKRHYLIKIKDIAVELGTDSTELIKVMQRQKLPIWLCG